MTPDEFRDRMAEIVNRDSGDPETLHLEADTLCWDVLTGLGYRDGIDLLNDVTLWYA